MAKTMKFGPSNISFRRDVITQCLASQPKGSVSDREARKRRAMCVFFLFFVLERSAHKEKNTWVRSMVCRQVELSMGKSKIKVNPTRLSHMLA